MNKVFMSREFLQGKIKHGTAYSNTTSFLKKGLIHSQEIGAMHPTLLARLRIELKTFKGPLGERQLHRLLNTIEEHTTNHSLGTAISRGGSRGIQGALATQGCEMEWAAVYWPINYFYM